MIICLTISLHFSCRLFLCMFVRVLSETCAIFMLNFHQRTRWINGKEVCRSNVVFKREVYVCIILYKTIKNFYIHSNTEYQHTPQYVFLTKSARTILFKNNLPNSHTHVFLSPFYLWKFNYAHYTNILYRS